MALRSALLLLVTPLVVSALAACGGGGGDSPGSGNGPPLTVSVSVNNAPAAPGASYTVAPTQSVQLTANKGVAWSVAAPNVTLRSTNASATGWSSQVGNLGAAASTFTVTATAGSESVTLNFNVSAGDPRNGRYRAFGSNGTTYSLVADFDLAFYAITDPNGTTVSSGSFSADGSTGNFAFGVGVPAGQTNVARFGYKSDAIVGAFPFAGSAVPFVASRRFATSPSDFANLVDFVMFGREFPSTGGVDSSIFTARIEGAVLTVCTGTNIVTVPNCGSLSTTLIVYDLTYSADGSIRGVARAPSTDVAEFSVARIGTEWVYLRAKPTASGAGRTRIGLQAQNTLGATATGGDTRSAWGTMTVDPSAVAFNAVTATGTTSSPSGSVVVNALPNLFLFGAINDQYFIAQTPNLVVVTGVRNPSLPNVNGYQAILLRP